ncbi:membrane insertase OXA1/ALB3/YidC, partial [Vararia minispora EC-137]
MTELQDGFMDLALALPFPLGWPPYATTIILATVASRIMLTLPFSLWARRRMRAVEEHVLPALAEEKQTVQRTEQLKMMRERFKGTQEELDLELRRRFREAMTKRRDVLLKQHAGSPIATMLIPILAQAPLFVGMSYFFVALARPPAAFILDAESFLSLTSMTHTDPTAALPIALGILTLANVESANWFLGERAREIEARERARRKRLREEGKIALPSLGTIVKPLLRGLSVVRIVFGTMMPGTVIVYWVTSAAYGLVQTWIFDYLDRRR